MATRLLDGITGRPFDDVQVNEKRYFALTEQGEEGQDDSILLVYPRDGVKDRPRRPALPPLSDPEKAQARFGEVKPSEPISETIRVREAENEFILQCVQQCEEKLEFARSCSAEFAQQCKSLLALYRNTASRTLPAFGSFLDRGRKLFNEFLMSMSRLSKKPDQICADLISMTVFPRLRIAGSTTDSLLKCVVFAGEGETRDRMIHHYARVVRARQESNSKLEIWKSVFLATSNRLDKLSADERFSDFRSFVSVEAASPQTDRFGSFRKQLEKYVRRAKEILSDHTARLAHLKREAKRSQENVFLIQFASEMRQFAHLKQLRDVMNELTVDTRQLLEHKIGLDTLLYQFFDTLLQSRYTMKNVLKSEDRFVELLKKIDESSLRELLFAQNLPQVYQGCVRELLRRSDFVTKLRRDVALTGKSLVESCEGENSLREKFVAEQESALAGLRIPQDLVRGIYLKAKIPSVDLSQLDPELPHESVIRECLASFDEDGGGFVLLEIDEPSNPVDVVDFQLGPVEPRMVDTQIEQKGLLHGDLIQRHEEDLIPLLEKQAAERRRRAQAPDAVAQVAAEETREDKLEKQVVDLEQKIVDDRAVHTELQAEIARMQEVGDMVKRDKNAEIQKLASEKQLLQVDLEQQVSELVRQKEEMKVEFERSHREQAEKMERMIADLETGGQQQVVTLKRELAEALKKASDLETELLEGRARQSSLEAEVKSKEEHAAEVAKRHAEEVSRLDVNLHSRDDEFQQARKGVLESERKVAELEAKLKSQFGLLQVANGELENGAGRINQAVAEATNLRKQVEEANRKRGEMQELITNQVKILEGNAQEIQRLTGEMTTLRESLAEAHRRAAAGAGQPVARPSLYPDQLRQMKEMFGATFTDKKIVEILEKHHGDIARTVDELCTIPPDGRLPTPVQVQPDGPPGVGVAVGLDARLRRSAALYDYEINDRVFFSRDRKRADLWEALNWNVPRYYLHPDVVASLRQTAPRAKVCMGKIIVVESVDHRRYNPLNLAVDYHLITIEIEQTRR